MLLFAQATPSWTVDAPRIKVPSGRHLAYELVGDRRKRNAILWFHGVLSSRWEARAPRLELLEELDAFTVGVDRPSYGQSDPHARRTFQTWAEDISHLADALDIKSFFVAGVSGGGPYALATAYYLPDRVRGVLLLSPASNYGLLSQEQRAVWDDANNPTPLMRRMRAAMRSAPWLLHLAARVSETQLGGRVLYERVLKPAADNIPNALAPVDRECLEQQRPEHLTDTVPESMRQKTGAALFQDLELFGAGWSFDVRALPPDMRAATHVWQGTGDRQTPEVGAVALAAALPGSHLHMEEGGGHFAYWSGNKETRKKILQELLASGRHP